MIVQVLGMNDHWGQEMRFLITGGAGFIGSNFVKMLLSDSKSDIEAKIIVLDNFSYSGVLKNLHEFENDSRFKIVKGSITNSILVKELVSQVDVIVNFAAESHVDNSILNPSTFLETNTFGVQVLLDSMREYPGKRLIQISTDEVYGSIKSGAWTEDRSLEPNSPYSATKASAELLVRAYVKTFDQDIVVTRASNNYGPNQHPEKLIPKIITNLLDGRKIPIYGNGKNIRDWLSVQDHCEGILNAVIHGKKGETYNLGGGNEYTNLEIAGLILNLFGYSLDRIDWVNDRLGHDFRYAVDSGKAKRDLNFKPRIQFIDGLQKTVTWYRENEEWWRPLIK
jgi:dTDP-glucose 4,6-dehydratase